MAPEEQVELGHPHRVAASMCDSLVPQHAVRQTQHQGWERQGRSGDLTCSKCALHPLKTL